MSKTPQNAITLDKLRAVTQGVTMVAAVLYGLTWLFMDNSGNAESESPLGKVLLACVVLGGIAMGALYAAKRVNQK